MDPDASDSQALIRDGTRKLLASEAPLSLRKAGVGASGPPLRAFWEKAAGMGITSLLIPEAMDGAGLDDAVGCLIVVAEEAGRAVAPGPLIGTNVVADTLARIGSQEQQEAWLPGIATGEVIAGWALGERPDFWLPSSSRCHATQTVSGFRLDGVKVPVEVATDTDLFLVTTESDDGLVQLLVPRDAEGVTIVPLQTLDVAHSFGEIVFDGVEVPFANLIGDPSSSAPALERQLDLALCIQAAETAAIMESVFDLTVDYLRDRYAFGRAVASYQAVKHRLAEHKVWLEAALGVTTALARSIDGSDPVSSRLASTAKVHIAEQSMRTISDCSQLLGGISMTWEHDHHVYFRRATVNRALYGAPSFHRERLCRLAGL